MRQVDIELTAPRGTASGVVRLSLLPNADEDASPCPLQDLRGEAEVDPSVEPVQVLEGKEYRYEFLVPDDFGPIETDRTEVFFPDTQDGRTGRFRPGLRTGTIPVKVTTSDETLGSFAIEVRSRKFEYLKHYRWMLRDLAEILAEVVMERFATAEQKFSIDEQRDAVTLYQRFVFLQSLLNDEHLLGALHLITSRPYVTWETEQEIRSTRKGVRSSSHTIRQLARPGPRINFKGGPARLSTVPRQIRSSKTYSTVDNGPNRFVKFALIRWRNVVSHILEILEAESRPSAPIRRGIREARALQDQLDAFLSEELFRDVGDLTHFPANSQVLQKRAGYRAVYQTYIQFELASKLSWDANDVYGAGQRDVATLYEYWIFLQVVQVVSDLCDLRFDLSSLFSVTNEGLSIGLKNGTWKAFDGVATAVGGRKMRLDVHFNKRFSKGAGSWTRTMRPDCSLRIRPVDEPNSFEDIWVHFDAKYRIHRLKEIFSDDEDTPEDELPSDDLILGKAKGEDLLKMHAYRDAIRRSAGAYVLYPGSVEQELREFHELLPGLGAFPLRPTQMGTAGGAHALKKFIKDVLNHAASQVTQHERGRYWTDESYQSDHFSGELPVPPAPFLPRPPADTLVLLGYVKNEEHRQWIHETGLYNLRADKRRGSVGLGARELAADLVVLYGPDREKSEIFRVGGEPRLVDREGMEELVYPKPGGQQYFALPVHLIEAEEWTELLPYRAVELLAEDIAPDRPFGGPRVSTWLTIAKLLS